jgi:LEA14-like dessication related protein
MKYSRQLTLARRLSASVRAYCAPRPPALRVSPSSKQYAAIWVNVLSMNLPRLKSDLRAIHRLAAAVLLLTVAGCQSLPTSRPLAPDVKIESVKAVKLSLTSQELAFRLMISNPNDFDLPLQSLAFVAALDDTEIARGMSNERITIPANDEAILEVRVSTRINKLLGQLLLSNRNKQQEINYDVKGFVKLANWPARLPFNVDGKVDNPVLK